MTAPYVKIKESRALKDNPAVKKGQQYFWWVRNGERCFSKKYPTNEQLEDSKDEHKRNKRTAV